MHRVSILGNHFGPAYTAGQAPTAGTPASGGKKESLTVTDNRTGIEKILD